MNRKYFQHINLRPVLSVMFCVATLQVVVAADPESTGLHAQESRESPFELHGIFRLGNQTKASLRPRNGEGKAFWLKAGQSRGPLSLIEIDADSPSVVIRYGDATHTLHLHEASDLPIPLHLTSDVVERDGRLMRKMRVPAGRGRPNSSGTVLMPVPENQTRPASGTTTPTASGAAASTNTAGETSSDSLGQEDANGDGESEELTQAMLREFQTPARRASIRAKALRSGEAAP